MSRIAGIDVGGTFTDLIVVDDHTGEVRIAKVPTTVQNQAFGVLAALDAAGVDPSELEAIVHGTTTTTNAMLERKIAKVGLITTMGFRDVLELGRRTRPTPYGLKGKFVPLVERHLRLEVDERIDAEGQVLVPLDDAQVEAAASQLVALGAESVVIHFLHSCLNPAHELRAEEIVREVWPNRYVTAGHRIVAEYREYERGTTAAVNAAIQPVLHRYIERLQAELGARGFARELLVMQGNGGTVSSRVVAEHAVATVMSGPASGVIAAAATAMQAGSFAGEFANVVTYDMGGTSSSSTRCRSTCRWSTCTPSVPAVARSPRSMRRACSVSVRKAPVRCRARSAMAAAARGRRSPTPISCSGGSLRRASSRSSRRCRWRRFATPCSRRSAHRSASMRPRRRRPSCASPTTAWPAPSAW